MNTEYRIRSELKDLQDNPILNIAATVGLPNPSNIYEWRCTISGPADTPFGGGLFYLKILFPKDYPNTKPEVRFTNKIYHLNVSPSNGHICISTLNQWKPKTPMVDVISAIFALFYSQNPASPYSGEMAREYESNRREFDRKAKEWTKKYASMNG